MATIGGSNIVRSGLVLELDAANARSYVSGSTVWRDVSGTNISGSLTNGPTFNSANGGSIVFNGSNQYVTSLPSLTSTFITSSFSVESWINITSSPPAAQIWFSVHNSGATGKSIHFRVVSGSSLLFGFYGDDLPQQNNVVTTGTWYQIINTYDSASDKSSMFLNGTLLVTGSAGPYTGPAATMGIGRWELGPQEYFKGNIAKVAVYNRALSSTEILQNYNAQKSRFGL
jgi:hypothetical protein